MHNSLSVQTKTGPDKKKKKVILLALKDKAVIGAPNLRAIQIF